MFEIVKELFDNGLNVQDISEELQLDVLVVEAYIDLYEERIAQVLSTIDVRVL
jgi:hypothetical protein